MDKRTSAMCFGKKSYATLGQAENVAALVARSRGVPLRSYQCPQCGHHHHTKQIDEDPASVLERLSKIAIDPPWASAGRRNRAMVDIGGVRKWKVLKDRKRDDR